MYHSIVEEPRLTANSIGVSQSRSSFEAHIRALARRFNPVTIAQIAQFARGDQPLPGRPVAVTFDDGFADNYDVALPILSRYGVPATFYIMVGALETGNLPWYCRLRYAFSTTRKPYWNDPEGKSHMLKSAQGKESALRIAWEIGAKKTGREQEEFVSQLERLLDLDPLKRHDGMMLAWDKVRALRRAGHIIGAHTCSHPNLAYVSEDVAKHEIAGSKKRLEEELGEPIEHFSYPHPALNPQWNLRTMEITREAGFKSAVLTQTGPVRLGDEPLALKRIYATSDLDQWLWNLERTFLGQRI